MSRNNDTIPYSRLFILGGKDLSEDDFKEAFGHFGTIKDVWCVKDKRTNERKGVVYIRFTKASEAIAAKDEMNGTLLPGQSKPLKVLMASDRQDGNVKDDDDDNKFQRLFIKVPKKSSYSNDDVEAVFSEYGEIEHINILKDKASGEPKGLAYITFKKPYCAAVALESCDESYKPVFAESRSKQGKKPDTNSRGYDRSMGNGPRYSDNTDRADTGFQRIGSGTPASLLMDYPSSGDVRLEIMTSGNLSQERLYALLDLIPGLDHCDLDPISGIAYVRYKTSQCASFAKERLSGFEYPIGHRLGVRFPPKSSMSAFGNDTTSSSMDRDIPRSRRDAGGMMDTVQNLVHSLQQATSILQSSGMNVNDANLGRVRYTNVPLPDKQPLEHVDAPVAERLFIVSQPEGFDNSILQDCLSRFGGLIDAYFMPRKNYGYAKFSSYESAQACMDLLHGQTVAGNRLKVIKADPPKSGYEDSFEERDAKKAKF